MLLLSLFLVACKQGGTVPPTDKPTETGIISDGDNDGDGSVDNEDCDDNDASVYPNAPEVCDGKDNNCDGTVDEGLEQTWYQDTDRDGYGDPATATTACSAPPGTVDLTGDCNDGDAAWYPGAPEDCSIPEDRNCDGSVQYADADGDGVAACLDCDDANAGAYPGAQEVCDPSNVDEDCSGAADDADPNVDPATQVTTWTDTDGDGYGDDATVVTSCDGVGASAGGDCNDADVAYYPGAPESDCADPADYNCDGSSGYSDNDGDSFFACQECNDGDAAINPAATEICDTVDNNCDGTVDEGLTSTFYADVDGDGFGDSSAPMDACAAPLGYVSDNTDCNDQDGSVNSAAVEVCDGVDNNCDGAVDNDAIDGAVYYLDADGDGYGDATVIACQQDPGTSGSGGDCDDADAAISPAGIETCNSVDDDCNGTVDDNVANATAWYTDADGDGYGDGAPTYSCTGPGGTVTVDGDCNDADVAYNPGASETDCTDPNDYNCDGSAGSVDGDGDGYAACEECNDADAAVSPGAAESCDGVDNNCDGSVDEPGALGESTWYADADGDGYGDASTAFDACTAPSGYGADATDCDDSAASVNPSATETCNSVDDDCNGAVDDNVANATAWYTDADGDGYGAGSPVYSCTAPAGTAAVDGDCNDTDVAYNPGATESDCTDPNDYNCDGSSGSADADADGYAACEDCNDADTAVSPSSVELCDGVDNNCDGSTDEAGAQGESIWYADADGDGYGDVAAFYAACNAPSGYIADASDCNDLDAAVYPSALESCNGVDDDCDGQVDDAVANAPIWYTDTDGDGYGDGGAVRACTQPAGAAALDGDCNDADSLFYPGAPELDCTDPNDYNCDGSTGAVDGDGDGYVACTDCDDLDAAVYPGAIEVCDGYDNDCNGLSDESGALGESAWYADADGDGFGDVAVSQDACDAPPSYVADNTDCDDSTASVNPSALEICDSLDNDCDGSTDVGAVNATTWYNDADLDGYGDSSLSTSSCTQPSGYAAVGGDCNDADSAYNPGVSETDCADPNDYNCDGSTGFADRDGDGFAACSECDDGNNAIFPGATEVCNGSDDNCDGQVDEAGATGELTWYFDGDGDNYGDATSTFQSCSAPAGYTSDSTDCNDGDVAINPGAGEYCDGIDTNCDGLQDDGAVDATPWYDDVDADGYGSPNGATYSCTQPVGTVSDSSDCDDARPAVNPGATEVCDGLDNNCDAVVDTDAVDPSTWYQDTDGDGYGTGAPVTACDQPTGYGAVDGDCNDSSAAYYPGASEVCTDVVDYNCDGSIGAVDADGDGFVACLECDDGNAAIYPNAIETCNGTDDNCDGAIDEAGALGELTWYADADGDGFGGSSTTLACTAPNGYVSNNTDCDDSRFSAYPGATESCNGYDDDCDGLVDEAGSVGETTWYYDADGDGYGGTTSVSSCTAPSGYVATGGDCDDSGAGTNPSAPDICDVIDNDCDGSIDEGGFCPCSVQTYGGHPYQFCRTSSNWNDAAVACAASPGYTLATLTSASENTWVVTTAFTYSSGRWWAGGYDSVIEGRWEWITGETWSYTNWAAGEGSSQSQDCLQLGNTDYTWADASCRSSGGYVCEGVP